MELRRLWSGDLPLDRAFWGYAVIGGLVVNLTTSLALLVLVAADRPLLALFVGYAIPIPYNIVAAVGVWRSAGHSEIDPARAELFRIIAVVLLVILSLT